MPGARRPQCRRDVIVSDASGGGCVVHDLYGRRPPLVLDPLSRAVFEGLRTGATPDRIRAVARSRFDVRLSRADVAGFIRELDEAGLLEGEDAERERGAAFRQRVEQGTLFVADGRATAARQASLQAFGLALRSMRRDWEPTPQTSRLQGALSPHGALEVTGGCAAHAYTLLTQACWPDVFFILGTSHYASEPAILTLDVQTALGRVRCDGSVAEMIASSFRPKLRRDAPIFLAEHSWQQDLPLLLSLAEQFDRPLSVVAMLVGGMRFRDARRLGRLLAAVSLRLRKQGCLVASGDLTHFGAGYGWRPGWLREAGTVDEVCSSVRAHERPILEAIAGRRHAEFERLVGSTSFCAGAQVAALMEFVDDDGHLLHHQSVVNFSPKLDEADLARPWATGDRLFGAASIAFALGGPPRRGAAPTQAPRLKLCGNVLLGKDRRRRINTLVHRCDHGGFALPPGGDAVALELLGGVGSIDELRAGVSRRWGEPVDRPELASFVGELGQQRLLHAFDGTAAQADRDRRERAEALLARARRGVPYYRSLGETHFERMPFLFPETVRARGRELFRDGAVPPDLEDKGKYYVRWSSASTGDAATMSAVESEVMGDRYFDAVLVTETSWEKTAYLSRPTSLDFPDDQASWPRVERMGVNLLISPGPNPTSIAPEAWDRIATALLRFEPEVLMADPAYLAGLARALLRHGLRLPSVRAVWLGHCYAWQVFQAPIRRAFDVPIHVLYHSSEIGYMGISCREGRLHLLETHVLYELLRRGRPAAPGEAGAVVLTTLDTDLRPLLRYVNGDVLRLQAEQCGCGRPFRVAEFEGRLRHLFADGRGRPVGFRTVDEAIGAPAGLDLFRLHVHDRTALLELVPGGEADLIDVEGLRERVGRAIGRRVRIGWRRELDVRPRAKFDALRTPDRSSAWRRWFLERR